MAWTKAQQKVIDTRNKNLLVSAAAGSGKTAVLVERIISMISEGEHPMDIDHLLVVTFTNAAAAEMRGRIGEAIDKKLLEQPDNSHLQKQISLLQSAQITTIHSFCLYVIRNYFHRIDLDPSFKIAEESEITLMKSDVISELLECWYEEGREDFHAFVESYSYSKSDAPIEELIIQLYNFSMSAPWPKKWIEDKRRMFDLNSVEEMAQTTWMKEMLDYIKAVMGDLLSKNEDAIAICNESDGPAAYIPALTSDRSLLQTLKKAKSYEEYVNCFSGISFERLSSKKQEGVQEWKKDKVKGLREDVKKGIKDIAGQFFFQSPEEMLKDLQDVGGIMQVLFDLTVEFMEDFAKKKEEKNLIDFNDLEHFALRILVGSEKTKETEYNIEIDKETESNNETENNKEIENNNRSESTIETEKLEESENSDVLDEQAYYDMRVVPTPAARELSELYDEILIDEYQDSNMVQETILKSISREAMGSPNRFMVGDVKQSIYKFRLAMPEIFMQKYETYSCEDMTKDGLKNLYQRIDLDRNFRSRFIVLDYVNKIFEQIMQKSIGGIIYDEAASLKYGELFEETIQEDIKYHSNERNEDILKASNIGQDVEGRIASEIELLLVTEEAEETEKSKNTEDAGNVEKVIDKAEDKAKDKDKTKDELPEDPEEAVYTKKEIEARMIARKIRELTDPMTGMLVFDRKTKSHRTATYRDIVILLRSMSGWSEVFVNSLMQEGISAYADTGTGYFQTIEIMTILNMLRIIDNPRQDIPLTGVLYSPIVGLSSTELAMIRACDRNCSMYSALYSYMDEGKDETLKAKVTKFMNILESFRTLINHKPIHELLQTVLYETGYYYYVCAMPGGDRRKANMDMLVSQAVRFEKGSYSGLFHFIRYMEKLHKYEVDFGEASTSGEQDNTVRIMSIHKSKGLEFPIVFVAGMHKQFNTQDVRSSIVLHNELGVGPEYIDSKLRTKIPTLIKKVIQKKVQIENMGEELRVLYVAMTRAKEKLILTGYLKSEEEIKKKSLSFFEILSAKSYLDWVLPATVNKIGWYPQVTNNGLEFHRDGMSITVISKNELLKQEITKQIFLHKDEEELRKISTGTVYNQELKDAIENRLNFNYPYNKVEGLKVKMTVSELKKLGQHVDEELSVNLYQNAETKINATIPDFIRNTETAITGTDRGTLYHKVLEQIDLRRIKDQEDLLSELNRLMEENRLKDTDIKMLKLDYIQMFVSSGIAGRMRQAELYGKLFKEKQFVMGIKASEVVPDSDSDELILIQGIIDVFFEEDGELVLLDYKSDLVTNGQQLVNRYKVQLEYYRKALEQIMGKKVKEMIIYSLPLGKEIRIDD